MLKNAFIGFATIAFIGCGTTSSAPVETAAGGVSVSESEALSSLKSGNGHKAVCDPTAKLRCHARIRTDSNGSIMHFASAAPAGLGPADFKSAYALDTNRTPKAIIAIVDAFGYPNAEADLAVYRSTYGLPACTVASGCLTIVNQDGAASPLPPAPAKNDDWTVETALDLDMASATCPNCKLLLVQANSDQDDGLFIAQDTAVRLGANVISDSWGGSGTGVDAYEHYFNHPGVGIFVASGDTGYNNAGQGPDYPSVSVFVTAVGGTALKKSASSSRGWTEKAWGPRNIFSGAGGSSCSTEIAKPSFQNGLNTSCAMRAACDVAAVGDPATGPAVYNRGPSSNGWVTVGGTSAASPLVAGIYALTGRGSALNSFAYHNTKAFFDVTTGKNDNCGNALCNAGAGWDGPTGIGTPNGAALLQTNCTPSCGSHTCGDDGCGGLCGSCASGSICSNGTCNVCTPSCGSHTCGSDGCGGSCGSCATGTGCNGGTCTSTGPVDGGGGGGGCHDVCQAGGPESPSCGACATLVCAFDAPCCTSSWDATCVLAAKILCNCKN